MDVDPSHTSETLININIYFQSVVSPERGLWGLVPPPVILIINLKVKSGGTIIV